MAARRKTVAAILVDKENPLDDGLVGIFLG